jgi:hypothetical protein
MGSYVTGPPGASVFWRKVRALQVPNADRQQARLATDVRFRVPLAKITTPWGFSFHPDGWHPYVVTLQRWLEDQGRPITETALFKLYDRFRPRTVQETLLEDRSEPVVPLCSWPVDAGLLSVWSLTPRGVQKSLSRLPLKRTRPRQFIGPAPKDFIEADLTRLIGLYESIRHHGFAPEEFVAPPIKGYFLVRDDDYRFICRQGSHRLAVLACLGYPTVEVSLAPNVTPIVNYADLDWWTVAHGGLYSHALVKELFQKMFCETGRTKAKNIGMLEQ